MNVKGLRVFLVEDEAMIRMMVVDMLEELGHTAEAEAGRSQPFRRRHPGCEPPALNRDITYRR